MDHTFVATKDQINQIIHHFKAYSVPPTTQYMVFRAKIDANMLTIYTTNKVHIQGPNPDLVYKKIEGFVDLPKMHMQEKPTPTKSIIGTDEVGTGDYFGGIVVTACFIPTNKIDFVLSLGVKDSKKLKDDQIRELAPQLKKNLVHASILLNNQNYNEMMQRPGMNMNKLKALMHNTVIQKIQKVPLDYDAIIIDGFTSQQHYFNYLKDSKDVQRNVQLIEKAEDQYLAVGAASIIARYQFLLHMDQLSEQIGISLPKGSSIETENFLYQFLKEGKASLLPQIAKLDFKTTEKIKARLHKKAPLQD